MKIFFPLLIAASLALNAILAYSTFRSAPSNSGAIPTTEIKFSDTAPKSVPPRIDPGIGPSLEGEQLPALVSRLRAADFPKDVIRAIVMAQIEEQFAARRKALDPDADRRPFWKDSPPNAAAQLASRQLGREQQALLRQLLGDDAEFGDATMRAYNQQRYSHLSPEKAVEIRNLSRQYDERRSELYDGGTPDPAKLQAVEKEHRAAIAAILTPDELLEHDLRTHRSASSLRNNLSAFQPTEAEFRAIFQLQRAFDEQFPNNSIADMMASQQARSDAQKQLTEQIKAALGPERAAEYERTSNSNYRRTSQLVARLELPPETTNQLWNLQKEYDQRRMDAMRASPGSSPADRNTQLAALQQEATARIASLLGGERHVEAYKQYGGYWLQNLQPRPVAPPAK